MIFLYRGNGRMAGAGATAVRAPPLAAQFPSRLFWGAYFYILHTFTYKRAPAGRRRARPLDRIRYYLGLHICIFTYRPLAPAGWPLDAPSAALAPAGWPSAAPGRPGFA
jgi:hypothetical protein